jgi:sporulation protein YlmC with PRC-barrel domain
MTSKPPGRVIDLDLHLLDRQVVDRDGKFVCKVDDIEFERGEGGALYVAKILVGPRARSRRVGGRIGVWMRSIAERLATEPMPTIDFANVIEIGSDVKIAASRDDLDVNPLEDWVRDHIVSRVPGSRHESK